MYFVKRVARDLPRDRDLASLDYDDSCGWFRQYPWNETFCPGGQLITEGTSLKRIKYAKTLEAIANSGNEDIFYNGTIADYTYETLSGKESQMSKQDLEKYKAIIRDPVSINYRGHNVTSTPIPASGTIVLSILKLLEKYPSENGPFQPGANKNSTHWLLEAIRYGYAQV